MAGHGVGMTVGHGVEVAVGHGVEMTVGHGVEMAVGHGVEMTVGHGVEMTVGRRTTSGAISKDTGVEAAAVSLSAIAYAKHIFNQVLSLIKLRILPSQSSFLSPVFSGTSFASF